jgi:hypothetical protein
MVVVIALALLSVVLVFVGIVAGVGRTPSRPASSLARNTAADAPPVRGIPAIKQMIRAGEWRVVWPALLVIGGLLGLMVFGAIALMIGLEQKATGVLMLAVALFAAAKIAFDYARA